MAKRQAMSYPLPGLAGNKYAPTDTGQRSLNSGVGVGGSRTWGKMALKTK